MHRLHGHLKPDSLNPDHLQALHYLFVPTHGMVKYTQHVVQSDHQLSVVGLPFCNYDCGRGLSNLDTAKLVYGGISDLGKENGVKLEIDVGG